MNKKLFFLLCLLSACQPESKFVIITYGYNYRLYLSERYYYTDTILRQDSCIVFEDLNRAKHTLCDSFTVVRR